MDYVNGLFEFIKKSPTAYHTVDTVKEALIAAGYTECSEKSSESYSDGGRHFAVRDGSSIIAWRGEIKGGFMICATHGDSPSFRVKRSPELVGDYNRLATEKYGGMIHYSWLDRPLSVAGRVEVRTERGIESSLVNIDRDLLTIPSVAIHMNRTVNDGYKFNPAVDLLPLFGVADTRGCFETAVAEAAGVGAEDIISHDLFLYNREEGRVLGADNGLILAPRLDDLACVYSSLVAFLSADSRTAVPVLAVFDNEEVGSETKQGAASTFLDYTLRRIAASEERYYAMLSDSFMVSADNAHAKHPNHPELADSSGAPLLGGGVVIKYNANQRYATDAVSDAIFRTLAQRAGAPVQSYNNRADMPGGSTLGSIADTRVSVATVDIGLPQLAMHSASECIASRDIESLVRALTELYSSGIVADGEKIDIVK